MIFLFMGHPLFDAHGFGEIVPCPRRRTKWPHPWKLESPKIDKFHLTLEKSRVKHGIYCVHTLPSVAKVMQIKTTNTLDIITVG
jgi:hypothetical protein